MNKKMIIILVVGILIGAASYFGVDRFIKYNNQRKLVAIINQLGKEKDPQTSLNNYLATLPTSKTGFMNSQAGPNGFDLCEASLRQYYGMVDMVVAYSNYLTDSGKTPPGSGAYTDNMLEILCNNLWQAFGEYQRACSAVAD